jgi:phosphomethylpyrimidine synthase
MTQLEQARAGNLTPAMKIVAEEEHRSTEFIQAGLAAGNIIITHNPHHPQGRPLGVGQGLRTKVNANLGTSMDHIDYEEEMLKARTAVEAGADAIMDLSTGGDVVALRSRLLNEIPQALGTVPVYETAVRTVKKGKRVVEMDPADMFDVIEAQAQAGVDFMTIHAGVTRESVDRLCAQGRIADIVSRGGAFMAEWMIYQEKENPYFAQYDRVLEICRKYDVTISLGDAMRPGCLEDATDRAQIQELIILGELARQSKDAGVQVMVEGPGHVPLDQVQTNIQLQKRLCENAPFYVLGPLVTDVAVGYDHIACAIGGAIAAAAGADFLCYVTPAEHLRLPSVQDVRDGVIASRIAAHAADIAKGVPGAREWDRKMAKARKALDWEQQMALALDPKRAREVRESSRPQTAEVCTMCGDFCAMKGMSEYLKKK